MARIFTISFTYSGEMQNAVVTVRTTPFYLEYTLSNLPPQLLRLLPGNKIISPAAKQFIFPNTQSHHSNELIQTIIAAVSNHLQAVNL